MNEEINWQKYLQECMQSTEFCCLATIDAHGVWSNPVYFAWDEYFNIYFMSQPHSRHMKNIAKDPRIAVSIYNTIQSTFDDVIGIQLDGNAHTLFTKKDVGTAYRVIFGRKYPDAAKHPKNDEDAYLNNSEWQFVKIEPENIYYFNTKLFDEERQKVPYQIFKS